MYKSQEELLESSDCRELVRFIRGIRCRECSHPVGKDLREHDGFVYCDDCGTAFNEAEEKARLKEIAELEKRLAELKAR